MKSKEAPLHATARVTSKGQVTVPKAVREALDLQPGDNLHFRIEDDRGTVAKIPDFLSLAGSVEVPPEKRGVSWEEIRRETKRERAKRWT